ncbi:MAG: rhodoquinone biosynthesis methyltransferase RquA [Rhodospirillales bacterium]|nr:rhodoquinone biosynthesis methyltransferase RquA [Rhodospirillales bacterium]
MKPTKKHEGGPEKDQSLPPPKLRTDGGNSSGAIVPLHPDVPAYLSENYTWAYLNPRNIRFLDHELVVSAILFGNNRRLRRATFAELTVGSTVLQSASVYGDFCVHLARHIGPDGRLDIIDVAPIQVARCRHKSRNFPQVSTQLSDAASFQSGNYDTVCCYFLLHEMPDAYRRKTVDNLLANLAPGGSAVFVDYHKPHWLNPLKPLMILVFRFLEPFAKGLWQSEIKDFAGNPQGFNWHKETYFAGMYQKVVARRAPDSQS